MGPDLVMAARTVSDLQDERAKGFIAHSLQIRKIDSPKLRKPPPPHYFLIELTGRVDIDRQWYDEGEGSLCPVCNEWSPRPGGKYSWGGKMHIPLLETWDGSDLLQYGN